jgi:hypothetical protein
MGDIIDHGYHQRINAYRQWQERRLSTLLSRTLSPSNDA